MWGVALVLFLVLGGFGPWGPEVRAGTVEGLYEATVAVSGQDARERDRALREALLEVVLRVSGQRRVPPTGVLSAALRDPARYVQESAFRTAGSGRQLWARFDPGATNELLRQAGLPAWGGARPTTLVWLAVERGDGRGLQGAGEANAVTAALEARSRVRGVPVLLPALDAQDRTRVRVEDVWSEATERVVAASRRYGADAVLIGHARERLQALWESRWTLVAGDLSERYNVDAEQLETAVGEALDRAVDMLAARHAKVQVTSVDEGPLPDLVVTGLGSFEAYTRTRRYLQQVDGITALRLVRLDPGRATFRLSARSDRRDLSRAIAQGRALIPAESAGEWTFQLVP